MTNSQTMERLRVLHVISGDLWAGAEAQAYTLLKHLTSFCDVYAVLMNEGELAERLRRCNIPVTIIDETSHSSRQIFTRLRKLMFVIDPAVVHTHRQKENVLGAIANATSVRAKCVRTVHGAPEFSGNWKTSVQRSVDHWIGNYLQDAIIAVSDELHAKLTPYFKSKKLHTIYNGVDVDELTSKAVDLNFASDKKHIGIIGRLVNVKRVDLFLELAAKFKQAKQSDYHFHIIGDGPLNAQLSAKAKQLDITDITTFHGHCDNIPSYIRSLDTVVMCSDHEGLPMVALETMALSTQLITSLPHINEMFHLDQSEIGESRVDYLFKHLNQPASTQPRLSEKFTAQRCSHATHQIYRHDNH